MSAHDYTTAPPPKLQTLRTKPTWHNRAGRVDRSACFVLSAAQLWRQLHPDDWTYRYPARQPAYQAKGKCDRYADRILWARDLWLLHKWEQPYRLQGDFRTHKSNALRHTPRPVDQRGDRPCAQQMRHDTILGHGPTNPNRGVGFNLHKQLGLDCLWRTTLRLERIVQHHNLKQHFLVCPVCGSNQQNETAGGRRPPGSTAPGERRSPAIVTKLYLPLCTPQEYDDAQLAQLWLTTHTNPNRPLSPIAVKLIERYGELFAPRNLRCRHCLGLRYGEVKAPKAADGIGGLTHERAVIGKTADPIGGFGVAHRPTEQQLFLTNLPKLLAKPRGKPRRFMSTTNSRPTESNASPNQAAINNHQSPPPPAHTPIDALPAEVKEKLYLLFAGNLPAFQNLQKVKQKSKHDV